jgi:hypothetical protein
MVERYEQPHLPSPLVGTPGVDKSAGKAAGLASELGTQAVNEQFAAARTIGQAAQQAFHGIGEGAGDVMAGIRHSQTIQALNQHSLDSNEKVLQESRQQDEVDKAAAQVQAKYPDNPEKWEKAFNTDQRQPLLDSEQERYGDNPYREKLLLAQKSQMIDRTASNLKTIAPKIEKDKQSAQIEHIIPTVQQKISDFPNVSEGASLSQIFAHGQKQIGYIAKIYGNVHDQAMLAAQTYADQPLVAAEFKKYAEDVKSRIPGAQRAAARTFWEGLVGARPPGDVKYVEEVQRLFSQASSLGLGVEGGDSVNIAANLDRSKQAAEGIVINKIQDFGAEKKFDATMLGTKTALAYQAGDNNAIADNESTIKTRIEDLNLENSQIAKEPDSKAKFHKLEANQAELSALKTGLNVDIAKQEKIAKDKARAAGKQERAAFGVKQKNWQNEIEGFRNELTAAHAIPVGPDQKKAVDDITNRVYEAVHKAFGEGTIKSSTTAEGYRKEFQAAKTLAGQYQQDPWSGFLPGTHPTYSRVTNPKTRLDNKDKQAASTGEAQKLTDLDVSYGKQLRAQIDGAKGDDTVKANAWDDLSGKYQAWIQKRRQTINPDTHKNYTEDEIKRGFPALAQKALNWAQEQENNADKKFDVTPMPHGHAARTEKGKAFELVVPPPPYTPSLVPELQTGQAIQQTAEKLATKAEAALAPALPLKGL